MASLPDKFQAGIYKDSNDLVKEFLNLPGFENLERLSKNPEMINHFTPD